MNIMLFVILLYVFICGAMWVMQRKLMYFPEKDIAAPEIYGLRGFEDLKLKTPEEIVIHAWYHAASAGYPTIIYFHGNAGNLKHRSDYFHILATAGFGILGLDYEGYGASEGKPSEQAFYNDARTAVNYALNKKNIPPAKLIFYGESIGTGVAVQMATEFRPGLVVLQSPYSSMLDLSRDRYKWLPVNLLLKDRFDSISKITEIDSPLLIFHGKNDAIVPARYGQTLFNKARQPKKAYFIENTAHNNFNLSFLAKYLAEFSSANGLIN